MDPLTLRDAQRWKVAVLPPPKKYPRARGFGLCRGSVVGYAEGGRGEVRPTWWPDGKPELLAVEGRKAIVVSRASGDGIPGSWKTPDGFGGGAVGWRRRDAGGLEVLDLHPQRGYARTSATASGGGAFVGYGRPAVAKGERAVQRALFWSPEGTMIELPAPDGTEAIAQATDGAWVGGRVGLAGPSQRAALWSVRGLELITLGDEIADVYGVGGGEQVGTVPGEGFVTRAALWRGSADSLVDLTPEGHETATAMACAAGLQVGTCCRDAAGGVGYRAALWAGTAASHFDLHGLVGTEWNASGAAMIEVDGSRIRVAGHVTRYESDRVVAQLPAIWEAHM